MGGYRNSPTQTGQSATRRWQLLMGKTCRREAAPAPKKYKATCLKLPRVILMVQTHLQLGRFSVHVDAWLQLHPLAARPLLPLGVWSATAVLFRQIGARAAKLLQVVQADHAVGKARCEGMKSAQISQARQVVLAVLNLFGRAVVVTQVSYCPSRGTIATICDHVKQLARHAPASCLLSKLLVRAVTPP